MINNWNEYIHVLFYAFDYGKDILLVRQFLVLLFCEFPWQQDFQIYFLNRNFFSLFVAVNFPRNLSGLVENHGMRSHWSLKIMSDSLKLEINSKIELDTLCHSPMSWRECGLIKFEFFPFLDTLLSIQNCWFLFFFLNRSQLSVKVTHIKINYFNHRRRSVYLLNLNCIHTDVCKPDTMEIYADWDLTWLFRTIGYGTHFVYYSARYASDLFQSFQWTVH